MTSLLLHAVLPVVAGGLAAAALLWLLGRIRHRPATPDPGRPGARASRGRELLAAAIAVALAAVIVAPIALSSGDLVAWAKSPTGLGLGGAWPWVVFVALDAAAAVCVGFVLFSAWRGEGAGVFGLLVWVFAGGSAFANYRHGEHTPAPDDAVFFAAMSLAGPVLLHMTVHRIRRWTRITEGAYTPARAHFGLRWLPGVAFAETLEAWKTSVRAGISHPEDAIAQVRERHLLANLPPAEQILYAIGAIDQTPSVHELRVWLADHGLRVPTQALEHALGISPTTVTGADHRPGAVDAPRALPARPPDTHMQRANPQRVDAAQHGNAALREQVAATYAQLLSDGEITPRLGSWRVAELIGQHARLPQSARTLQRYVQELRRQPTPPRPGPAAAGPAPAAGAEPEPAHQPPAATDGGLRLVGDRSTPAEPATVPAGPAAQPGLRTS
jgi:hypothetical protein